MSEPLVFVDDSHPSLRLVTLNRSETQNALSIELMLALQEAIVKITKEPDQRAIILKGAGPIFCAGLDLCEALEEGSARASAEVLARTFQILYDCPLVTIAAVHGAAQASGAGLLCACDLIVAAKGAKFAFPETHYGLVPALAATLLRRQVSERHLRELLFLGEPIDADTAFKIGLINRVVPPNELETTALKMALQASQGSAQATRLTKELIAQLQPQTFELRLRKALNFHLQARASEEAKARIEACFFKTTEDRGVN